MRTLLVFGASGAVGRFLLPQLPALFQAIPVSRQARAGWLCAGLSDTHATWPDVDAAISLGPLDAFAAWLKRRADPSLRRVIAFSSMSAESKQDSDDAKERAIARRLIDSEQMLRAISSEHGIALTIFRPTMIYGAGIDRSLVPIARFMHRWRIAPIPVGATGLRQPTHAADLAAACVAVLENPATYGKTYALGGGERLSFRSMLMRMRAEAAALPLPIPLAVLGMMLRAARPSSITPGALRRLRVQLIADNTAAAQDFGYSPRRFIAGDVLPVTNAQT
jgi:nucleoside-diphosphate-sugar epimerase